MGSIAHCLKKMGLDKHTERILRDRIASLKEDGYTHTEASVQAAKDYLDDLQTQRADVLAQMSTQGQIAEKDVVEPEVEPASMRKTLQYHDFGTLTPDQEQALKNTGGIVEKMTLKDRYEKMRANIGLKLEQGIVDQFAPLKQLDQHAYLLARLSKGSDGALEAIMTFGNLSLIDGVTDSNASGIGLIEQMKALEGEHHRFMWWVAAHRAEQLTAEQRERLFSGSDIAALKTLADGNLPSGRPRRAAYMTMLNQYNAASRNVLDIAEQSGIIDPDSRAMWEKEFYVPFYRALEDGISTPNISRQSGLVRQYAFKKLKGGKEKLHQDLLANVLMNWAHLLSASAKNRAAQAALEAAEQAGVAVQIPEAQSTKISVWFLRDGKKVYYDVHDPFTMDAITALEAGAVGGVAGKALAKVKSALTIGVTANPAFKVRNLIRDSLGVLAQSDISLNVAKNVASGVREMANKRGQVYASMLASGGLIRFGSMLEGNRSHHVDKLVKAGVSRNTIVDTREKMLDMIQVAWDHYNELGDISEGANRVSLYKQMRAAGKTHAESALAARDLLDFSKGGNWTAIRFLVQTVPFMNARIQGLYRLGQGAAAHPGRFAGVIMGTALASIALMLSYDGDDDWKKREDFDRDNYWWFKIGDVAYRIPKPFEVGTIATLAERGIEAIISDEMTMARFRDRVQYAVGQTLAFNPVPQMFKPMLDIYSNTDSFTGRPIETAGMEGLPKSERFGPRTSDVAKALGGASATIGLSPVQVDALVKGYFGWLGTAAIVAADSAMSPFQSKPAQPSMKLKDVFLAGNFLESLPADQSRYVTQFYEQAKEIDEAYRAYRTRVQEGDKVGAAEYKAENAAKIAAEPKVSEAKRKMSELNAQIKKIYADQAMDADTKRFRIDMLTGKRNAIAERASAFSARGVE